MKSSSFQVMPKVQIPWVKNTHRKRGLNIELHPADWHRHGRAAGPIRNAEMAAEADALIAFWDGQSRGTANMIKIAKDKGLQVAVVKY